VESLKRFSCKFGKPLAYLIAVLMAFLIAEEILMEFLIQADQRKVLFKEAQEAVENEAELVLLLIGHELKEGDYRGVERLVTSWAEANPDVLEIRVKGPEGLALAGFSRQRPGHSLNNEEIRGVYSGDGIPGLELVREFRGDETGIRAVNKGHAAGLLAFGVFSSIALWFTFRNAAVSPLEKEISERRRAEEALRSEREQLLSIFDSVSEIIYVSDPATHEVLYANRTLKEAFGRELVGGVCYREFQGLDSPCDFCTNGIIMKQKGEPYRWEYHNPVLDRDYFIVDRIIKWPDGRDARFEFAVDITERRRAEEALSESERRYRTFVQNFHGIAFRGNMDFVPVFFHGAVEEITGYAESDFVSGAPRWDQVVHEDDMPLILDSAVKLRGVPDTSISREYRIVRKDGGVRWVFEVIHNVCDDSGRPSHVEGAIYDITKHKRAEEALQESEERFRAIFDLAKDGIAVGDSRTKNVYFANRTFCEMLGYSHDEITRMGVMDFHPEEAIPYVVEQIDKTARKEIVTATDIPMKRKDGSVFYADVAGAPVKLGGRDYVMGFFRDITGRKKAEEALKVSLKDKEMLVRESSHRVKNNLSVISSLLMLQSSDIKDEGAREVFLKSEGRVHSMSLIHEMLYQAENLRSINIKKYAADLAACVFRSCGAEAGNVKLNMDIEDAALDVDTVIPCGLILNELITNALKHAFPGGRKGRVDVSIHPAGEGLYTLAVRDDGKGFPGGLDIRDAGTMGMQILTALTAQLDGAVEVLSEGGTEFRVTFRERGYAQGKKAAGAC
jgi:PAS domain S-box-containing protein